MTSQFIYTSLPITRSAASSQPFEDYNNSNQMPEPVSKTNVFTVPSTKTIATSLLLARLGMKAASVILQRDIESPVLAVGKESPIKSLIDPPMLVVGFPSKDLSESVEVKMASLGFKKEVSNRQQYYRGPPSDKAIAMCIQLGGKVDTFAPYGSCNIEGLISFNNIQRLILTTIAIRR